jgi:hypothetical protein
VVLDVVLTDRRRIGLVLLPLTSGAALLAYTWLGLPILPLTFALVAFGIVIWSIVIGRLDAAGRADLRAVATTGTIAGIAATLAYDLTRFGLVSLFEWSVQPFGAFPRFGEAILGPGAPLPWLLVAGTAFHLTNGIAFGIAYVIFVARPGIRTGILWALILEALMLLVYPQFLGINLPGEFLPMSLLGHLAYGSALGIVARRRGRARSGAVETMGGGAP